jgi:membrane protein implicated in regulation of membrane protease activity
MPRTRERERIRVTDIDAGTAGVTKGARVELGNRFFLSVAGVCLGVGVAVIVVFLLLGWAWYALGAVGALLLFAIILLGAGYLYDRREKQRYEELP